LETVFLLGQTSIADRQQGGMNVTTFPQTEGRRKVIVNEVLNAVTHGIGTLLSIAGCVLLILKGSRSGNVTEVVAYAIYGASMILLFLSSTLYHSFSLTRFQKIFRYIDHAAIYLLIAGTYTPFCLIAVRNGQSRALFIAVWAIAIIGIILKIFFVGKFNGISTLLYLGMGWMALFIIQPMYQTLGLNGIVLIGLGGLSYSLGTIFYSNKKYGFMHVIWHLFVLAGAAFMYFGILLYV
jgi:hemolysin III